MAAAQMGRVGITAEEAEDGMKVIAIKEGSAAEKHGGVALGDVVSKSSR